MEEKKADIFIKIDEYKEVLDVLELLKHKISQARAILRKINELKNQEDAEIEEGWNLTFAALEEIKKMMLTNYAHEINERIDEGSFLY